MLLHLRCIRDLQSLHGRDFGSWFLVILRVQTEQRVLKDLIPGTVL